MEAALACGIRDNPEDILANWDLCLLLQIFHARGVREGGIHTWKSGGPIDKEALDIIENISNREITWLSEQL